MNQNPNAGAPLVLMLHGLFGNARNWVPCVEILSRRWRTHAPQLPFFSLDRAQNRIEQLLGVLSGLLEAQSASRVVVLGNSFGGQLAVNLSLREPEKIFGLVLAGSSGIYERKLVNKIQRRPSREWLHARAAEIFFDRRHVTAEILGEIRAILDDRQKAFDVLMLAKQIRRENLLKTLPQVKCPVLLVWGAEDRITPPACAQEFHALLPAAELRFIPRCGHAPMLEHPVEFSRLVADFLGRLCGGNDQPAFPAVQETLLR